MHPMVCRTVRATVLACEASCRKLDPLLVILRHLDSDICVDSFRVELLDEEGRTWVVTKDLGIFVQDVDLVQAGDAAELDLREGGELFGVWRGSWRGYHR